MGSSDITLKIENVRIYDGSGIPPYPGDVYLSNDAIAQITGPNEIVLNSIPVIDGEGLALSPGWIDVHSHSDITLLAAPEAFGKISQGVTTEIVGNCGLSVFPAPSHVKEHLAQLYAAYNVPITWQDAQGYANALSERVPAVNVMSLCGHNTLRAAVCGYEDSPMAPDAFSSMNMLLGRQLKQGACGMSTGLLYIPGKFSTREELLVLMSSLKQYRLPYTTHLRSESANLLESLDEAFELAAAGSGILQISHLKTALKENWQKLPAALERIRNAQQRGLHVTADRYPYTFGQTSLSVILPPPYDKWTDKAILDHLASHPEACAELNAQLLAKSFWDGIILTCTNLPEFQHLQGLFLPEAAKIAGLTPASLTVELMRRDAIGTMAAFGGLSEQNMHTILEQNWVSCGSDENARPEDFSLGRSHPRGFGSFPKFIRYVASVQGMSEAIRRVSTLPASVFRIPHRGRIAPGYCADLVLFDEKKLNDAATFANPHSPAEGIIRVWVNGIQSYDAEKRVVSRNGCFLAPAL